MERLNKTIVFIDSATQINKTDDLLYLSFDFHAEQLVFIDPWSRPINTLFLLYFAATNEMQTLITCKTRPRKTMQTYCVA